MGSTVSGECSFCHEVIVVPAPAAGMPDQSSETLGQAFEQPIHKKSRRTFVA